MSTQPRLLLCSFDVLPGPSGVSRRLTEYLRQLGQRYSVVVLSAKTQDHSHIERYHGSRLLRVPVGTGDLASKLQAFERAVRRQLESEEYAIAHFTDPFGGYVLCELRAQYGFRLVYEANAFPSQELRFTHPSLEQDRRFLARVRRQELFCLMNADRVVVGSELTRRHVQALGVSEDQVHVLRAPVDLTPYTSEALGAPDGEPMRLLYLGSQLPWQGLPTLLQALAEANRTVDVRLAVVGPSHPEYQLRLIDLTDSLHLSEKVAFQAQVPHDDLYKVLATADACVVPLEDVERNRLQGGALAKVSEYLAAGRPVIAADLPLTRELLPAGCAVFYKPGAVPELAARIVELARDPARRTALGQVARAEAKRVDSAAVAAALGAVYDGLIGTRARNGDAAPPINPTLTATPTNKLIPQAEPPTASARMPGEPVADPSRSDTDRTQRPLPPAREPAPPRREPAAKDVSKHDTDPDGRPREPRPVMGTPLKLPPRPPPPRLLPTPPGPARAAPVSQPVLSARPARLRALDEPEEISSDEVVEADEVSMVSRVTRMDPWFALLVHGYCPPEGIQFGRHTPPTTMPGRDEPEPPRPDVKPPGG